jgi:hypothetical protein
LERPIDVVQGTFITEWDEGKLENEELLRSEQVAESYADQLVAIARCVRREYELFLAADDDSMQALWVRWLVL